MSSIISYKNKEKQHHFCYRLLAAVEEINVFFNFVLFVKSLKLVSVNVFVRVSICYTYVKEKFLKHVLCVFQVAFFLLPLRNIFVNLTSGFLSKIPEDLKKPTNK